MKKNTKIMIGLASIVLLASLILIVINLKKKEPTLESKLSDLAVEFYEKDYKVLYPNFLKQWKEFTIDLDGLKGAKKDVSEFEAHKCDMNDTYVTLTYKDNSSYDIDVHLACEE